MMANNDDAKVVVALLFPGQGLAKTVRVTSGQGVGVMAPDTVNVVLYLHLKASRPESKDEEV